MGSGRRRHRAPSWVRDERVSHAPGGTVTRVSSLWRRSERPFPGRLSASPRLPCVLGRGGGELCEFFEGYAANGNDAAMPPGIYSLDDLKQFGRDKG